MDTTGSGPLARPVPTGRLRVREGATISGLGDDAGVVLDVEHDAYLALNASAAVLWARLEAPTGAGVGDLASELVDRFGLTEQRAAADAAAFVADCLADGLLEAVTDAP